MGPSRGTIVLAWLPLFFFDICGEELWWRGIFPVADDPFALLLLQTTAGSDYFDHFQWLESLELGRTWSDGTTWLRSGSSSLSTTAT